MQKLAAMQTDVASQPIGISIQAGAPGSGTDASGHGQGFAAVLERNVSPQPVSRADNGNQSDVKGKPEPTMANGSQGKSDTPDAVVAQHDTSKHGEADANTSGFDGDPKQQQQDLQNGQSQQLSQENGDSGQPKQGQNNAASAGQEQLVDTIEMSPDDVETHETWIGILQQLHIEKDTGGSGLIDDGIAEDPYAVDVGQVIDIGSESPKLKQGGDESILKQPEPIMGITPVPEIIEAAGSDPVAVVSEPVAIVSEPDETLVLGEQIVKGTDALDIAQFQLDSSVDDGIRQPEPDVADIPVDQGASHPNAATTEDWKQGIRERLLSGDFTVGNPIAEQGSPESKIDLQDLDLSQLEQLVQDNDQLRQLIQDALNDLDSDNTLSNELSLTDLGDAGVQLESMDLALLSSLVLADGKAQPQSNANAAPGLAPQNADTANADVKAILNQLEQQLANDQAKLSSLESLVQRLELDTAKATPEKQQFITSLKAGIEEMKAQLKNGREPGIDLQAMVTEALGEVGHNIKPSNFDDRLTQALQQIQQVSSLQQFMTPEAKEQVSTQLQHLTASQLKENNLASAEFNKQVQANNLQDKPINIAKPEAANELANKVQVMVNQKNMVADIRLDPPDLGSMQIKITMQGDTATVSMVVQSQQARDVLEQSAPRLREMLQEQGIQLGQSSVREESQGQNAGNSGDSNDGRAGGSNGEDVDVADAVTEAYVPEPDGIDYFV